MPSRTEPKYDSVNGGSGTTKDAKGPGAAGQGVTFGGGRFNLNEVSEAMLSNEEWAAPQEGSSWLESYGKSLALGGAAGGTTGAIVGGGMGGH